MSVQMSEKQLVFVIAGYEQEHTKLLRRAVFAEAEKKDLEEQLHQERLNQSATIQGLNSEIENLNSRLMELQNAELQNRS